MIWLVVVLCLLVVGLPLVDRFLLIYAENRCASFLAEHAPFAHRPSVIVHGVPFLSQALRGEYSDIEISGTGLQIGEFRDASLDAHLQGARVDLRELRRREVRELPCSSVVGEVRLSYLELDRLAGIPGISLTASRGGLLVTAALPVPGLSLLANVSGMADLQLEGRGIRLRVRQVAVAGFSLPSIVTSQLIGSLSVLIPLPVLPYGLQVDSITVLPDGLSLQGSAEAVVLRAAI